MEAMETRQRHSCLIDEQLLLESPAFNIQYGCRIIFKNKREKNQVRYKLNIQLLEKTQFESVFVIDRLDEFYINDQVPSNASDICAFESNQFIFPLIIGTDRSGQFKEIKNFEEISQRWPEHKESLEEKFDEQMLNRSVSSIANHLASRQHLEKKLKRDWFLCLYFSSIYRSYTADNVEKINWSYPIVVKAKPVNYNLEAFIEERQSHYRLNFSGTINDERSAMDLEQFLSEPYYALTKENAQDLEGTSKIVYLINTQEGIIDGYDAKFETSFEEPQEIHVSMFRMGDGVVKNKEGASKETEPEKKSFFGSLFNLKGK